MLAARPGAGDGKATERGGCGQRPSRTVGKPLTYPGRDTGPAEAPRGPCCFPLVGFPEPTVDGWMLGELRGGGEVLKLGQDVLPKFKDYAGSVLETPGNKQD